MIEGDATTETTISDSFAAAAAAATTQQPGKEGGTSWFSAVRRRVHELTKFEWLQAMLCMIALATSFMAMFLMSPSNSGGGSNNHFLFEDFELGEPE